MAEQIPRKSGEKQELSETEVTREETNHTLTDEEVNLLEQFKVMEGSLVWVILGITGAGKSCVGNFILGAENNPFSESSSMISETAKAALQSFSFDNENLCVIDTPGLADTENVGGSESEAEDVAYDYSTLATELTKVVMMTNQGINAFLIIVQANHRDFRGLKALLGFLTIIGDYWNHSILVVTHGKKLGNTEEEQYTEYHKQLANPKCPAPLKTLWDKVSGRLVIVEAKKWKDRPDYHRSVVGKIMKYSKEIQQHCDGPFKDDMQSIGKAAHEKAMLDPELRKKFVNFDSPQAQKAIYQSTFKHVTGVIHRLVRIKLAGGEDVDKLKKMAELKEGELEDVRNLTGILRNEYQELKQKRKEAEESLKQAEKKQVLSEQKRKQAEGERDSAVKQKKEADKKRVTAEQQKEVADDNWRAAELKRERAEGIRKVAEQQRDSAEKNETAALQEKKAAERTMKAIRQDLQKAETEKTVSDQQRQNAEKDMQQAINQSERAERSRVAAIEQKEKADRDMREAENQRDSADRNRAAAVEQKVRAESDQIKAEQEAEKADKGRRVAEHKMDKAESEKKEAEEETKKANDARIAAEQKTDKEKEARVAAEQKTDKEKEARIAAEQKTDKEKEARVAAEQKTDKEKEARVAAEQKTDKEKEARIKVEQKKEALMHWGEKEEKKGPWKRLFKPAKLPDSVKEKKQ